MRWVMASSFLYKDTDIGVLTATRAVPVAHCTLRVVEPLHPAAEVVGRDLVAAQRLDQDARGRQRALDQLLPDCSTSYEAQLAGVADAFADHDGPIILAGDLNTWTDARLAAVHNVADAAAPRSRFRSRRDARGSSAGRSTTSWCAD